MSVISEAAIQAAHTYNEAEIRFHILDPIIRHLGYPESDNVYLFLEEKLDYPYIHIGRRSKKDLPLGYPDYRAGLKGARGSFIIEAKAGSASITAREVEQAHSYAAHSQVGANYFVLCNGEIIAVYLTLSGAQAAPILELPLLEVNLRFYQLENILAPINLERNCRIEHDTKLKLARGLGSSARIRSGVYSFADHQLRFSIGGSDVTTTMRENLSGISEVESQLDLLKSAFELRVADGQVERGDDGKIIAQVEFAGATIHNRQAMKLMGLDKASFVALERFISTEPNSPTIFESLTDFSVTRGTMMPRLFGGLSPTVTDVRGDMFIKAAMHFAQRKLQGEYTVLSNYRHSIPGNQELIFEFDFVGEFELELDV